MQMAIFPMQDFQRGGSRIKVLEGTCERSAQPLVVHKRRLVGKQINGNLPRRVSFGTMLGEKTMANDPADLHRFTRCPNGEMYGAAPPLALYL